MQNNSNESIPLILDFCQWLQEQKKSQGTITTYKRELERFQEWLHEKQGDITHLSKGDIQNYILFLQERQKSVTTIDKIAGALRTFSRFLGKPDLTFGIKLEPVIKDEFETLTSDEYELLLTQVKMDGHLRDIAIVYLFLHTGIRISELCNLNRSNIDFLQNDLIIGKDDNIRTIPLSTEAKRHLVNYLDSHSSEQAVFVSKLSERITERTVQYMLKKYNVNPNKLRHTFCQRIVDSGVDLSTVSRLAGIKDLNIIKRYVKRSPINRDRLEEIINNTFINDVL